MAGMVIRHMGLGVTIVEFELHPKSLSKTHGISVCSGYPSAMSSQPHKAQTPFNRQQINERQGWITVPRGLCGALKSLGQRSVRILLAWIFSDETFSCL